MEYVLKLQQFVWGLGWFTGKVQLTITLKSEFEGFYGRASENWEKQVVIKLESPDTAKCPSLTVIGKRHEGIDEVAKEVLAAIEEWKSSSHGG
jgi:hypothetical protein